MDAVYPALPNEPRRAVPGGAPTVGGGMGVSTGGNAALLRATYNAILQARGVPYLSHDDPALLMLYQAVGGLPPELAAQASRQASDYFARTGHAMTDVELDNVLGTLKGSSGGQNQYNPLVGVGAQIRQDYSDLAGQRGAPVTATDPQLGAAIQHRIPGLTAQQAAQVAQRGADFYRQTGVVIPDEAVDQYAGQVKQFRIPLPHQMDPAKFDAMMADPVAAGLFEGTVKASGYDWDTYKRQHYAARPTGTATGSTGGGFNAPTGVWG